MLAFKDLQDHRANLVRKVQPDQKAKFLAHRENRDRPGPMECPVQRETPETKDNRETTERLGLKGIKDHPENRG